MMTAARFAASFVVLAAVMLCVFGLADEPARVAKKKSPASGPKDVTSHAKEVAVLQQSAQAFRTAFNQNNAKAVAALWTEDGNYIDESGKHFEGRDAIEKEYVSFFSEHPGAKMTLVVDSLRLISDDAAIEDGRAVVEASPVGIAGTSNYTVVHVKRDGKWLMSTVRDSRREAHSVNEHLQDLEWLVGNWSAEENGATMEAVCRWVAEKSFLERTSSVKRSGDVVSSGVQIIGWNPQRDCIQSWVFTSDGGHAVGVWTPRDNGWAIETSGTLADGTVTSAVNIFMPVDDHAFSWQSVERSAGGVELPDIEEVVLRRVSAGH